MAVEAVERPLPKPSDEGYIEARLLEALAEAGLALEFLGRGLTRNAAGKALQAWRALLAALLRLELGRLKTLVNVEHLLFNPSSPLRLSAQRRPPRRLSRSRRSRGGAFPLRPAAPARGRGASALGQRAF
jgi:hypothetical protein